MALAGINGKDDFWLVMEETFWGQIAILCHVILQKLSIAMWFGIRETIFNKNWTISCRKIDLFIKLSVERIEISVKDLINVSAYC